jgi:hypothetical protein
VESHLLHICPGRLHHRLEGEKHIDASSVVPEDQITGSEVKLQATCYKSGHYLIRPNVPYRVYRSVGTSIVTTPQRMRHNECPRPTESEKVSVELNQCTVQTRFRLSLPRNKNRTASLPKRFVLLAPLGSTIHSDLSTPPNYSEWFTSSLLPSAKFLPYSCPASKPASDERYST